MIKIERKLLEKKTKKKIIDNARCLGIDTATRTGWCLAEVKGKFVELDYGFVHLDSKDTNERFNYLVEFFNGFISKKLDSNCSIIIEDVFFGKSALVLKFLARIGMILYILAWFYKIPRKFILAIQARSFLGLTGNAKKVVVQDQARERFGLKVEDEDIIDAIILALNGVLKEKEGLPI